MAEEKSEHVEAAKEHVEHVAEAADEAIKAAEAREREAAAAAAAIADSARHSEHGRQMEELRREHEHKWQTLSSAHETLKSEHEIARAKIAEMEARLNAPKSEEKTAAAVAMTPSGSLIPAALVTKEPEAEVPVVTPEPKHEENREGHADPITAPAPKKRHVTFI